MMKFEYAPGATPLDPDEINGLIPLHITTQNQLNEWEADEPRVTWGRQKLETKSPVRKKYIDALSAADKHNYATLAA
jgi:hypothetical protein